MYLSELNIVGFKSFAKKTSVLFHDGITAIVGPNGCGKSNIVDSIRWVMGEQKSGVLRSERMENVIFAGSASAKPVGMAEVSLTIENTKNLLPVEYTDVVITRRLFRSGESQYLINGNVCRLKDINDLFMDTGMGAHAYSVIELPQVEELLNGKEEERRRIFEEAAGITKYKLRRKATLRKLEATEKDLIRVEDIMSEVDKTVRSLRRQVVRAQRYQQLASELKELEIKLADQEYSKLLAELEPMETRLDLEKVDRESAAAVLASVEAEYESTRIALLELEKKLAERQKGQNELVREIQKQEERVLINSERIRSLQEAGQRYLREKEGFSTRLSDLLAQSEAIAGRKKTAEELLAAKQAELAKLKSEFDALRTAYEQKRSEQKTAEKEIFRITEELSRKRNESERLRANEENLGNRLQQLEAEEEQDREQFKTLRQKTADIKSREEELAAEMQDQQEKLTQWLAKEDEARRSLEGLQKADLQDRNRIEALEQQADLIKRLLESYEDYPAGVRFLATQRADGFSVYGTLANVIRVQRQHRSAIAAALGEMATYLVVENLPTALNGVGLLKQERKGVVSFIALQEVALKAPAHPPIQDLGVEGWANELVQCEERFRPLVDVLLGDLLLVQDLETARRVYESLKGQQVNVVTFAGEVLGHRGLVRGGSHSKSQIDFVGRQEQMAQLRQEIEAIDKNIDQRDAAMAQKTAELEQAKIAIEALTVETKRLESKLAAIRIDLGKLTFAEQTLTEAESKRETERQRLLHDMSQLGRNLELQGVSAGDLENKRQEMLQMTATYGSDVVRMEKEVNASNAQVQALSIEVARLQSNFEALQREYSSVRKQADETQELIRLRERDMAAAEQEINDLIQVNAFCKQGTAELEQKRQAEQIRIEALEEEQYNANTKIAELENRIRASRSKFSEVSESSHKIELRVSELRIRLENLQQRMREEFEYTLQRQPIDEAFNLQEAHQRIEELRGKVKEIGPVNLLALKEYEQEKERLDFLQTQREDLIKARKNLTDTIDIINATARQQFLRTFEEVQKNFSNVFKTFFDGGRASLVLREGNDPLEADIDIYATPGGKKLSSLQLLSGGEKSLTAISLLFAIYLVKPSPFCIFDEVDAPLDDQNVLRFTKALKEFSTHTQFIVVTHNKLTMRSANQLYGVTMEEEGISKVVSVKFESERENVTADAQTANISQ